MGLALDEPKENEVSTNVNGLDVLIAEDVKAYADQTLVDYEKSTYQEGFTVRSQYATSCQ